MNSVRTSVLVVFIGMAIFIGCDSNVDSTPQTTGGICPNTGSTFVYDSYATDSNGAPVSGTERTDTAHVTGSNMNYMGKTKVYQVEDNGASNYYAYETSGDVSMFLDQQAFAGLSLFVGNSLFEQWYLLPIVSHIKGLIVFDTSMTVDIPNSPLPVTMHILGRIDYVGQETLTVKGETFTAEKCKLKVTADIILGVITFEQEFSFIPKIGYLGKQTTKTIFPDFLPVPESGEVRTLVSYNLIK